MKPGNRRQRLFSVEGDNSFIVVVCLAATTVSPFMSIQTCCALIVFTAFILYSLQFSHKTSCDFCISVCGLHDDAEEPTEHVQQGPTGMKVCLHVVSLGRKSNFS